MPWRPRKTVRMQKECFCQPEPKRLDIFAELELEKIREHKLAKIG